MNVSPASPLAAHHVGDLPQPTSDAARLAALLVETEDEHARQSQQALASARERVHGAIEREYRSLLDGADAAWTGALVGGACTIAGGAAGVVSALGSTAPCGAEGSGGARPSASPASDALAPAGRALLGLAGPLDALIGQSTAKRHDAEARLARQAAEDAKFDAEQRVSDVERGDRRSEQALEFARAMAEAEARADQAVLSSF
jgi:hypothetical protein